MNDSGTQPLAWSESGPVDLDGLKEAWGQSYTSSSVVRASYHKYDQETGVSVRHDGLTLGRALRYDLRPFQEDVWVALAERRMGVPGGSMREIQNPWREPAAWAVGTTSDFYPLEQLQAPGGVLLWPRMHRVRRYGALAPRGFSSRLQAMRERASIEAEEDSPICKCPDCGEALVCEKSEDGRVMLLSPWEGSDLRLKLSMGKRREMEVAI
jgi:hypothetical protein